MQKIISKTKKMFFLIVVSTILILSIMGFVSCGDTNTELQDLSSILATVGIKDGIDEWGYATYKYGFIDKTGKVVIDLKYDWVGYFSEGLVAVGLDDKYGFIDKTGKVVIDLKYDDAWYFSEGLATVGLNGEYGFIDKTGKVIIDLKYDRVRNFSEGLAVVKLDGESVFIDKTGKVAIDFKYDTVGSFSEGLAIVGLDEKIGFIDKTGKVVIDFKYEYAYSFSEGLAAVIIKDGVNELGYGTYKYGFIDKTGKVVIDFKYDTDLKYNNTVGSFSEGLAAVGIKDGVNKSGYATYKYGFIDKTGKVVIDFKYDDAWGFSKVE